MRKIQTKAILDELSASATINHTVQSPSGAVAYTYGETGDFRSPMMKLAPSRLPPIVRKTSLDRDFGLISTYPDLLVGSLNSGQNQYF